MCPERKANMGKFGLRIRKGTSLVVQCIRPKQGTQVQSLAWEDPTNLGATKPEYHNYQDCPEQQLQKPTHLEPELHNKRGPCNEKPINNNEEQILLTATRESPNAATETQHSLPTPTPRPPPKERI